MQVAGPLVFYVNYLGYISFASYMHFVRARLATSFFIFQRCELKHRHLKEAVLREEHNNLPFISGGEVWKVRE
jgi:hypothetical protein